MRNSGSVNTNRRRFAAGASVLVGLTMLAGCSANLGASHTRSITTGPPVSSSHPSSARHGPVATQHVVWAVPATIPHDGVMLDSRQQPGSGEAVLLYLRPATAGSPLSAARASAKALEADNAAGLAVSSAVFANATVPGEVPPPGSTAPSTAVVRRNVRVVTVHAPAPTKISGCVVLPPHPPLGEAPCRTSSVQNDVLLLDATTGQMLAGFFY